MSLGRGLTSAAVFAAAVSLFATEPNDATRRWWSHVAALSGDGLQGRDTGSAGYRKAAEYVVTQFERAGLQPAGEHGYYQTVPLHQMRLVPGESTAAIVRGDGTTHLQWLHQLTIRMQEGLPEHMDLPMVFAGTGEAPSEFDSHGSLAVSLAGSGPLKMPEGVAGAISIDNPKALEPSRWPLQYAVTMRLQETAAPQVGPLAMRFNPAYAEMLFAGSGHTYAELAGWRRPGSRCRGLHYRAV